MRVRIIGDVHGHVEEYLTLATEAAYSIQLGDIGFRAAWNEVRASLDAAHHRVVLGNHDDYSRRHDHSLGDWGYQQVGPLAFFFVRGGRSLDKRMRTIGLDYFPDEEVGYGSLQQALDHYEGTQVFLSHEAPYAATDLLYPRREERVRSRTATALQALFEKSPPALWIFGHHHRDWSASVGGTRFVCLAELSFLDL